MNQIQERNLELWNFVERNYFKKQVLFMCLKPVTYILYSHLTPGLDGKI